MSNQKLAVIVHRWGATPESDWYPWLQNELLQRGYDVAIPAMPHTDAPEMQAWIHEVAVAIEEAPYGSLTLVGHSIGCQTILRYLEKASALAAKVLFVAGWVQLTGLADDEEDIAVPWLTLPIDTVAVKSKIGESVAFFSSDDPLVPATNQQYFRDTIGSRVVILHDRGHFDEDTGVLSLPELLQYM
jgi:uncharacterized protein